MNLLRAFLCFCVAISIASPARAQTTAPTTQPADFAAQLDLSELRALSLQDRQTIKTWDTYARQTVSAITGRSTLDGREPLFSVLDIAFRPEAYRDRNILKIKNVPLRQDFKAMPGLDPAEAKRILEEGTVSLAFWLSPPTQAYLQQIQQEAVWKSDAIGTVQFGAATLRATINDGPSLKPMSFVPPVDGSGDWLNLTELSGNIARLVSDADALPIVPGYDDHTLARVVVAISGLRQAWGDADAGRAQQAIDALVNTVPSLSPNVYPSAAKRHAEVLYNKLYKLTLPGAAVYFVAFTLFIVAAYSQGTTIRKWGVAFMALGLLMHLAGVLVRWWLDQKSTGSWFYSIPIKNQFESVMMSALFGVILGLGLEIWRKKSLFGAAACFVGWMSLIALFTVPYVFGKDIGGEINRAQGILMSYWLYIHVTLATASYALIGMSFLLGVWWLVRYVTASGEVRAMRGNMISADAAEQEMKPEVVGPVAFGLVAGSMTGGIVTGAVVGAVAHQVTKSTATGSASPPSPAEDVRRSLANLDAANVVILQLAFWILAVAIVCGAIWADVSWGRPWGWDPKETFALVTWIVYLIVIHVRLVTTRKAFWTAILTIVGFFIMLFNWIGVNYFLVGLHSYA